MIDSLLYAKLPPKLKRSVNMARLENGSYDEIVAHLERELELNALEESDDLPMATMTSSSTKPKTPLSTGQMSDITCNYCKEKGHKVKDCEKLKKKKEKDAQQGKSTQKKTYPECGTCGKKNHPEERCWQGAGAHLKPKRTRPEDSTDNKPNSKAQKPQTKPTSSSSQSSYSNDQEQAAHYVSSLIKTNRNPQNSENYWFSTPENPGNPEEHTPIQKRILRELQALQDLETLDPTTDAESRAKFLENFDWKDSTLTTEEKEKIEELLVEFHDIFARHRFDIGMNEEFKVKLTPKDDSPAYSQSLPAPINLKEDILVELAMLHKYGIITTLPFSKYASPIFAQKKPNGKPRLLVDLRKINNLISDDYITNNHPVSTLVDAAQHLAGNKLFCKLDCSQAYHCLPMADQLSMEMLAFNCASRTFAYRRLAQGLSRSLSAFSSFMREYLDKVTKEDQCAQYVDDIGIAANDADHLIANLRATFKCIQEAGLKLTMHKCHFGAKEIDFLGRTITPEGVKPQKQNVQNFVEKTKFPKSKKALLRYLGFLNYYRNYVPRLSERIAPFYKMLKSDEKVLVSKELVQQFEEINRA